MAKNQVVRKVRRDAIAACLICPLCDKLIREATTIPECLHSFCRKCIYDKIEGDELECCPICNIDLGCVPLDKLRPDHNLQDVRAKVFPSKRRKVEAMTVPMRRKERSLSSLVVSALKASSQSAMTNTRTKSASGKAVASQGSSFIKKYSKEEATTDGCLESLKFTKNTHEADQIVESSNDAGEEKSDLWKPLHDLVEAANQTKPFKSSSKGRDLSRTQGYEHPPHRNKMKGSKFNPKLDDRKGDSNCALSDVIKPKRLQKVRPRRASSSGESRISPQKVLDAAGVKHDLSIGPVWFSLVASEEQEGDEPLPQVPACYIRVKDANLPVSFIQKYLTKKLHLRSETEVEIKCLGQTVLPTLLLYNLIDLWLQTASTSRRVPAITGSSAKDFVMVLAYSRKLHP